MILISEVSSTLSEGYPSSTCNMSAGLVRAALQIMLCRLPKPSHRCRSVHEQGTLAGGHPYADALPILHNTALMATLHCMAWKAAKKQQPHRNEKPMDTAGHLSEIAAQASVVYSSSTNAEQCLNGFRTKLCGICLVGP